MPFVFSPAGEPKDFSVFQCPPKAASVCSVAKTLPRKHSRSARGGLTARSESGRRSGNGRLAVRSFIKTFREARRAERRFPCSPLRGRTPPRLFSTSRYLTQRRRDAEASLDGPAGFPGFGARGEATVETPLSPRLCVSAFNSPSREGKGKLRAARLPFPLRRMGEASRSSFAIRRRRGGDLPLKAQKRPSAGTEHTEGRVPCVWCLALGAGCGDFPGLVGRLR